MNKILITGAAGFIGFHLIQCLSKKDFEIVGIDNINDYYDVNLKLSRLNELGICNNKIIEYGELLSSSIIDDFRFCKIDLVDLVRLKELFIKEKFTHVINLAAQAGVRYSIENPHAYIQSNIVGFVNLLECCRYNDIKHLIYASSSSVYGTNSKVPFSEGDRVDSPVSLYAATKKSNELMAFAYSSLYDLPTTGLRFFTVYGPWGRPDMAPMLFADAIVKGETLKVFNNGDMQRDFTFIEDIINGIEKIIDVLPTKEPRADIFNIGNSRPIDLMSFIVELENQLGKKAKKKYLPMQDGDVKMTFADTSYLTLKTSYNPSIDIEKGVFKFVSWFKKYYQLN